MSNWRVGIVQGNTTTPPPPCSRQQQPSWPLGVRPYSKTAKRLLKRSLPTCAQGFPSTSSAQLRPCWPSSGIASILAGPIEPTDYSRPGEAPLRSQRRRPHRHDEAQ
jgi:hypothetical protein